MTSSKHGNNIFRYVRQLALVAAIFGILLAGSGPVSAATSTGSTITTSPVSTTLSASPGSTVTTTLQLQNNDSKSVNIAVKLEKFKAEGENGQAQIYAPQTDDPSISWVHFSESSFVAEPGVWKQIKMTVDVPKSAAFGYYYAVVFSPVTGPASIPGINTFRGANAILVLLNVHTPGESSKLEIASFSASQHIYQYLPVDFTVKVHNPGDIYTAPRGDIYISRSENGPAIDNIELNKGQGNVLPGTNRNFQVSWDDGFPVYQVKRVNGQVVSDKSGRPVEQLVWDFTHLNRLRFGQYYARVVMVYSDGGRDIPVQGVVSFWVIPWVILLVLLVVLLLIGLGLWTVVRMVVHRRPRHIRLR